MVDHGVHGDWNGGLITEDEDSEGVSDEDQWDAHLVEDLGALIVVAREHDKALAFVFESTKVEDRVGMAISLVVPGLTPPGRW